MAEKQKMGKRQQQAESLRSTLEENVARAEANLKKLIKKKGEGHSREPEDRTTNSIFKSFLKNKGESYETLGEAHMAASSIETPGIETKNYKERGHVNYVIEDINDAIQDVKKNYDDGCAKRTGLKFEDKKDLTNIITHNTKIIAHDAENDNQPIYNQDLHQNAFDTSELIKAAQQAVKEQTGIDFSADELSGLATGFSKEAREAHEAHLDDITRDEAVIDGIKKKLTPKLEEKRTGHATKRMLARHPEKEGAEMLAITAYLDQQGSAPDNVTAVNPLNKPNTEALKEEQQVVLEKMQALREEMHHHKEKQNELIESTFEDPDKVHASLSARDKEAFAMSLENMPDNKGLGDALVNMSSHKMMENKIPELVLAAEPKAYGRTKDSLSEDDLATNAATIADSNLRIKAVEADLAYLEEKFEKYNCHIEPFNSKEQRSATMRHMAAQMAVKDIEFKDNDQKSQAVESRYNSHIASKSPYHNAHVIDSIENQISKEKAQGDKANTYVDKERVSQLESDLEVEELRDRLHDAHVNEKERAAFRKAEQAKKGKEEAARKFEALEAISDTLQENGMEQITLEGDKVTTIEPEEEAARKNESLLAQHINAQQERALTAGAEQGKSPEESLELSENASDPDFSTKIETALEEAGKEGPVLGDIDDLGVDHKKDNEPTIDSR